MDPGQRYNGFVPGRHGIDAYGRNGFRFADMSHRGSILVLPSGIYAWPPETPGAIDEASLAAAFAEAAEIDWLLLGTGATLVRPAAPVANALEEAGIPFEAMQTGVAARMFNILLAEDRRVAAALLAVT